MSGFLKLEGITGETGDPKHRGEFDIDGANFGVNGIFGSNPVPEKTPIITVKRRSDKDSAKFFAACCAGAIFPVGKITLDFSNKIRILTMSKVLIQSIALSGHSQNSEQLETISLSVEKYSIDGQK